MKQHLAMMAHYNRWANERVFRAAAALSDADWLADHGAFFGSLCGTLNHLLVTDRIWMRRFTGDGPLHTKLDDIVTEDRTELTRLREAEDVRIIAFVEGLDEDRIDAPVIYGPLTAPDRSPSRWGRFSCTCSITRRITGARRRCCSRASPAARPATLSISRSTSAAAASAWSREPPDRARLAAV